MTTLRQQKSTAIRFIQAAATVSLCAGLLAGSALAQDNAAPQQPPISPPEAPAAATPGPASPQSGRFTMTPAANGFLRLDTRTGAVSLCQVRDSRVTCQSGADDRTALEAEITRLSKKNAELQQQLANASKSTSQRLREVLPTDKDMDKALTYAEKFMRRMMRIMREDEKMPDKDRI